MLNKFILVGKIVDVDLRDTGNAMVWVKASNHPENHIANASMPSWYTPIVTIRISQKTIAQLRESLEKSGKKKKGEELFKIGEFYNIEGTVQGIKRLIQEKEFYSCELQALRIFKS